MIWLLLLLFALLVLIRVPIAFALGIACAVAMVFLSDVPLAAITHKMVNGIDSYIFLAIPLFILAGMLMNAGGITDRLFRFARVLVGSIPGGLGHANIFASMLFSWMSGSAVATAGGLGEIEVKAMKENGYDLPFAESVATIGSILGPIIPPSIPLIIYAAMTEESLGKLFLGGILPGLLIGFSLMVTIYVMARMRGYPRDERASFRIILQAGREALIPILMPVIMLGGIISGVFTPTEAAAVAAAYALVISLFFYRTVSIPELPRIFVKTMVTTAVVTFIISTTAVFSMLLSFEEAGTHIAELVLGLTKSKYLVLLIINILLLVLGAIMEAGVVLILFIPILYPLALSLGIDPIHFGVILCVNLMIGVATPPVGMSLFVMSHISKVKVEVLMWAILPFLIPILICLLIITYVPEISTALPDLLMQS